MSGAGVLGAGLPGRTRALVVTVAALAVAGCALLAATAPLPDAWRLAVAVLLLAVGRAFAAGTRLGDRRVVVFWYELSTTLTVLLLLPIAWCPLLSMPVVLAERWLRQRPGRPVFNAAAWLGPVAVAALLAGSTGLSRPLPLLFLGEAAAHPGQTWIGTAVGVLVAAGVITLGNTFAIAAAVAAATGDRIASLVRQGLAEERGGVVVQTGATLAVAGLVLARNPIAALIAAIVGLIGSREYLHRLQATHQRDALQLAETATGRVDGLSADDAFAELFERAAVLFGATEARVWARDWPGRGPCLWAWSRPDGVTVHPGAPAPELAADELAGGRVLRRSLAIDGETAGLLDLVLAEDGLPDGTGEAVLATYVATVTATLDHCRGNAVQVMHARTDALTGLGNRLALSEGLTERLADAAPGTATALVVVDLDHFKEVNDTLGHDVGDGLLVEVAGRLRASLASGPPAGAPLLARVAGDRFALVLSGLPVAAADAVARRRAVRLLAGVQRPLAPDGLPVSLEARAGIALSPAHGTSAEDLSRYADEAVARARFSAGKVVVYEAQPGGVPTRIDLLGELRLGLEAGEFRVVYQPLVDLTDGSVVGAEALVRWDHPTRGELAPAHFIGAAERTSLIMALTDQVLDRAVFDAAGWRASTGRDVPVSVNLSPRCLLAADLPQRVAAALARHGLPASCLTLEITESLALADLATVGGVLTRLRAAGVGLAVDDFGTGYSSMSFVREVHVQEIKIDKSFVTGAVGNASDRAIVASTIALGRGLELPVVGEGVETVEQLRLLQDLGCTVGQGYLLGRPMAPERLRAQLDTRVALLDGGEQLQLIDLRAAAVPRQVLPARPVAAPPLRRPAAS
ncbi:MAG: signaling protein [Mycobacterium sp.]|nr:signaling protein [Mycobacterium sp.]